MQRLTGSVEHHEDWPFLFLQQLPEVLKRGNGKTKNEMFEFIKKQKRHNTKIPHPYREGSSRNVQRMH